ncbi:sn-glycerol-3-phosphate ABC transporter ATP-binding protein UgpC [candidate division KSB1 bacterium]|nr:sn-glycerol-3-phosphate ABC transporter ATP-binding protein UgpC [candidate division KSB1 bacterium]RQW05136.1 MAG: sn-glycerol-3-phosphate ABC transporter ATP-binding protein UgpC [candidate division KSB1 bacterium]
MAQVNLRQVTKVYENFVAVKAVNIDVHDKEFIVLVGPSGCGKSTILRMIAGLEDISSGDLLIDGRVVNNIPPKDRDIAMVFQNYALYPHMTVYDNMAFGLKLRNFPKADIDRRVKEAAEILDISFLLHRKPKALSGGQRQRVAVGRAIVRKPKVFLFDEPLSNLDAKLRVQMRTEIAKLHSRLESTMVYVTHDQVEAMTMGDRIVVLRDGLVQQIDTPINLYNQPVNKFVAGFIGSPAMNFVEGRLLKKDRLFFHSDAFSLAIPETRAKKLESFRDKKMTLGIRPEHLHYVLPGSNEKGQISAQIDVIETMGNETVLYVRVGKNTLVARISPHFELHVGLKCQLKIDQDKIHFFDQDKNTIN